MQPVKELYLIRNMVSKTPTVHFQFSLCIICIHIKNCKIFLCLSCYAKKYHMNLDIEFRDKMLKTSVAICLKLPNVFTFQEIKKLHCHLSVTL